MLRKRGHRDDVSESGSEPSSADSDSDDGGPRRRDGIPWILCLILTVLAAVMAGLGWWMVSRVSRQLEHSKMEAPEAKAKAAAAYLAELDRIKCNSAPGPQGGPACLSMDAFGGKHNMIALLVSEASAVQMAAERAGSPSKLGLSPLLRPRPPPRGEALPSGLVQEDGAWPLCLVRSRRLGGDQALLPSLAARPADGAAAPAPTAAAGLPSRKGGSCYAVGGPEAADGMPGGGREPTATAWSDGTSAGIVDVPPADGTAAVGAESADPAWRARPWVWPTLWRTGGWMDHEDAWADAVATGPRPGEVTDGGASLEQRSKALKERIRRGGAGLRAPVGEADPRGGSTALRLPVREAVKALLEDEARWAESLAELDEAVRGGGGGATPPGPGRGAGSGQQALGGLGTAALEWVGGAVSEAERRAEAASAHMMGLQDPTLVQAALRALDLARAGTFSELGGEASADETAPCRVLSVGVERDWSFETAMASAGCRVTALDPSIDRRRAAAFGRAAGVRFLPWAVAGRDGRESRFGAQAKAVDSAIAVALGQEGAAAGEDGAEGGLEGAGEAVRSRVNPRRAGGNATADDGGAMAALSPRERAAREALDGVRRAGAATGPTNGGAWRHRSLSSLLRDHEATGIPPGSAIDVLKIDSEGAEWEALEDCLDAGRECWGRMRQLTVELHNVPDDGWLRGGARASGERMQLRAEVMRRLREEAGFVGVRYHVNPVGPPVDIGGGRGSAVPGAMPCCGEALWVRSEDAGADDDDA